ncbi:MAG: hypothetical protein IJ563_03865 [Selenomonadaceae bacterium]|nr:hypothetical protein [Selenomonadaceae bacterium]
MKIKFFKVFLVMTLIIAVSTASVTFAAKRLTIINNSGSHITSIWYRPGGTKSWSNNAGSLQNGITKTIDWVNNPVRDFKIVFSNGQTLVRNNINLNKFYRMDIRPTGILWN